MACNVWVCDSSLVSNQVWDMRVKRSVQTFSGKYQVLAVCFGDAGDQVWHCFGYCINVHFHFVCLLYVASLLISLQLSCPWSTMLQVLAGFRIKVQSLYHLAQDQTF